MGDQTKAVLRTAREACASTKRNVYGTDCATLMAVRRKLQTMAYTLNSLYLRRYFTSRWGSYIFCLWYCCERVGN